MTGDDTRAKLLHSVYSRMTPEVREEAQQSAIHIRGTFDRVVRDTFDIGSHLIKRKIALGRGLWGDWIKAEFSWTERTAQIYMRVAERLGGEAETVSVLGVKALNALSAPSTPKEVIDDVVARLKSGEHLTSNAVLTKVKEAREEAKKPPASDTADQQRDEQHDAEASVDDFGELAGQDNDRQADIRPSAELLAEWMFKQSELGWIEFAPDLKKADLDEVLRHLIERVRRMLDGSVQHE